MTLDKVAILIKKTALVIDKLSNHVLAPYELTNTQYKILMLMYHHQGASPLRQADIETHFSMTNPTVTGIIQNLEKKELVQRVPNPDDKRSKLLVLTEQALALKGEIYALGESLEQQITSHLTPDESQQLIALLKKILSDK